MLVIGIEADKEKSLKLTCEEETCSEQQTCNFAHVVSLVSRVVRLEIYCAFDSPSIALGALVFSFFGVALKQFCIILYI